jgi:cellulose 1,4-beta-cellobiosidase
MKYLFLLLLSIAKVNAHGFLEKPTTRDSLRQEGTIWRQYMPIFDPTLPEFVCRNLPINKNKLKIKSGTSITVKQGIHASHPGPCYFYIGNEKTNEWYKFAEFQNCETTMGNDYSLKIPDESPACIEDGCVLRWEWHALHLRNQNGGRVEYYTNCVDIYLESESVCRPTTYLQLPGHVPTDPNEYWYPWITSSGFLPFKHTSPSIVKFDCDRETRPTRAPTTRPTTQPTRAPTTRPTTQPTRAPTTRPTTQPTRAPTTRPTTQPTRSPTTNAPITKDRNPFLERKVYIPSYLQDLLEETSMTATGITKSNLEAMKNIPSAFWVDVKAKARPGAQVEQVLKTASSELVVFVVYDLPNRDCHAKASNGEICCYKKSDGTCDYMRSGDCAEGLSDYRENYIDALKSLFTKYNTVPIVAIIEPDSLPNLATNRADPRCGNSATETAYKSGIAYAVKTLSSLKNVVVYIDAAHGGWLGWENNAREYAQIIGSMDVISHIRGFATNVANYQPLGTQCPTITWCLNGANPTHPCCADPCKLLTQWNPGNNEMNYVAVLSETFKKLYPTFSPKFIIDTGRNGVTNMRQNCANWCNIRNAGAGVPFTTNTLNQNLVDAYFWVKFPGESDGCTQILPDGKMCPRFDSSCASVDSIGSRSGEPRVPEAGQWFEYHAKQFAQNAVFSAPTPTPTPTPSMPQPKCGLSSSQCKCPAPSSECSALYGQCGGRNWNGPKCCRQGVCKFSNDFYSQCLPS